jgi:hypothetical protein
MYICMHGYTRICIYNDGGLDMDFNRDRPKEGVKYFFKLSGIVIVKTLRNIFRHIHVKTYLFTYSMYIYIL